MTTDPQISFAELDAKAMVLKVNEHPSAYLAHVFALSARLLQNAIDNGAFEHPEWVASTFICLADNYIKTLNGASDLASAPRSWRLAFLAAASQRSTMQHHLLLALNAHFRLTWPLSLSTAMDATSLKAFKRDFLRINSVLEPHYQLVWKWVVRVYRLDEAEEAIFDGPMGLFEQFMDGLGMPKRLRAKEMIWIESQKFLGSRTRGEAYETAIGFHQAPVGNYLRADLEAESIGMALYRPHWALQLLLEKLKSREPQSVAAI